MGRVKVGTEAPYTDSHMIQVEIDDDFVDIRQAFADGASMQEGVSGRKTIDTTFENTKQTTIQKPMHGEQHDLKRHRYPHREF